MPLRGSSAGSTCYMCVRAATELQQLQQSCNRSSSTCVYEQAALARSCNSAAAELQQMQQSCNRASSAGRTCSYKHMCVRAATELQQLQQSCNSCSRATTELVLQFVQTCIRMQGESWHYSVFWASETLHMHTRAHSLAFSLSRPFSLALSLALSLSRSLSLCRLRW